MPNTPRTEQDLLRETLAALMACAAGHNLEDVDSQVDRPTWQHRAACRGAPTRLFFRSSNHEAALAVCARCPVVDPRLAYALADDQISGVWGGTTDADRAALRAA